MIEAGARTNALYADDGGRIAIGKITLVFTTQMKVGNTPTVRLEQDGSSEFTAQKCVVAQGMRLIFYQLFFGAK